MMMMMMMMMMKIYLMILDLKNALLVSNKQLTFFNKYILKNKPLPTPETSIKIKSIPKS